MNRDDNDALYVSPAAVTGCVALALAPLLALLRVELAAIPLAVFVLLCLSAPFFPARGFFLPLFSRGHTGRPVVSLTFDDGPDPMTTRPLLQLLERHAAKATFFVTGERAARHGDLMAEILACGHDVGNHSYHHDPFLMLRRVETLHREIASAQTVLGGFGLVPAAFRPPVGVTSPKLYRALLQRRMFCVNFSCRAFDGGNRYIRRLARRILKKVKPDDVILLHDVNPPGSGSADYWLQEVEKILAGLKDKGLQVVQLADLLGKQVMVRRRAEPQRWRSEAGQKDID
jgi:peptidoglycan/xylan/chitin deacetylase (PgdA/CDA1 family)